ncbi:MAG: ATP-dependent helicase HrpB [Gemmatimonadaceae bacterium]
MKPYSFPGAMTSTDSDALSVTRSGSDHALPVDEAIPALRAALRVGQNVVLQAPPGAGKSTHVPLALLHEPWLAGSRILMLEPRRLAARAVAQRMAFLLGERTGETVGYRVRRDTLVGPRTRIEVVTEGILTRMLQHDPTLEGVGVVIFDEFHERSVHAEIGLALALHSRALVRPDLRIMAMSATLDGARVAELLDAPVVTSVGRSFPVEVTYMQSVDARSLPATIASSVMRSLENDRGDILVFLPGGREIRQTASMLESRMPPGVRIEHLYGDLSRQAQDMAIAPAAAGARKVVLSTPIAETSLTIEGIGVVIDSGLARVPRFSPRSGMTRLQTVRISRASADQRAGRAGRLGPGRCYRLWPEHEQHHLAEYSPPEILQADLAPLILELAAAGIGDVAELCWLDTPPAAAVTQASQLLALLGALGPRGNITRHGREMAEVAVHPRVAHMLLVSREGGAGAIACDIAAILEERDFVRGANGTADADIALRVDALRSASQAQQMGLQLDHGVRARVLTESTALMRQLGIRSYDRKHRAAVTSPMSAGAVLALAYPDRIGRRRGSSLEGRFLLRNGRGANLTHPQELSSAQYIVAAELDGDAQSARIFLAASLTRAELDLRFADQFQTTDTTDWDEETLTAVTHSQVKLGAIILDESQSRSTASDAATELMISVIRRGGLRMLPWSNATLSLRKRIAFLHARHREWPDVSDDSLDARLETWLRPLLAGRASLAGLGPELDGVINAMLDWRQRSELERLAPQYYVAPTGTRVEIDYSDTESPSVAVRLQEMFGLGATPAIDNEAVTLTLHLLSPARRPVQVTRDLAGFWRSSYFEVRKELRGRYPKHVWPEDPASHKPTARAKPRGKST